MEDNKYPQPMETIVVIIVVMVITLFLLMMYPLYRVATGQPEMGMELTKYFLILGTLPTLILPYVYSRLKGYDTQSLFRFKRVPDIILLISFVIGISMSIVGDELDRLIQIVLPTPEFLEQFMVSMRAESALDWIVLFAGVVLGAAFSEEMVYRGFLQVALEKKGDVTRAVLLSSLAWTILHGNPYWAVPIFIMGVVIGFLVWRTGSIIPGIIVHGTNNFLSLIASNFEESPEWYMMGDHVSPVILIPALIILVYSVFKVSELYKSVET